MEILYSVVCIYLICWAISVFIPKNNQASRTASNVKKLADSGLEVFNNSLEETIKQLEADSKGKAKWMWYWDGEDFVFIYE